METKMMQNKVDFIRRKLGFDRCFVVDCKGRNGGLLLLWKLEVQLETQNYSCRHINAVMHKGSNELVWKITCFYGHPKAAKREEAWNLRRFLSRMDPIPWMCVGDFNEILVSSEKTSSSICPYHQMRAFQLALEDCNLSDLGFSGPKYTWCNGRYGDDFSRERLDMAVANVEWIQYFNTVKVEVLARVVSDRHPLPIHFSKSQVVRWNKYNAFRYEASWFTRPNFSNVFKQAWQVKHRGDHPWKTITSTMKGCRKVLQQWVRKSDNNIAAQIQKKTLELHSIQKEENSVLLEEFHMKEELNSLLQQEALHWCRRAKEN
jgi:hypothetical protein